MRGGKVERGRARARAASQPAPPSSLSVVVLDHHKTALEQFPPPPARPNNLEAWLDMGRSGSALARAHFSPSLPPAVAAAYAAVNDGDLWTWGLPTSRAFYAGLAAAGIDFDAGTNPGMFAQLAALDFDATVATGTARLAEQDAAVREVVAGAFPVAPPGGAKGFAVDLSPSLAGLRSSIGHALADASAAAGRDALGVVAYREPGMGEGDGRVKVSLRSVGAFDAAALAAAHGGGGHRNAASCMMEPGEWAAWRE